MPTDELPSAPRHRVLTAGDRIGERYEVVRRLGGGGMGEVWLVTHRELGVKMALKLLTPSLVADAVAHERLRREARLTAQLTSPHALVVHDHGDDGGRPFVVMEWLRGESLKSRLEREGRLPAADVLCILEQVGDALAEGHDLGVVHRDIKPSNVFLARGRARERAKLLDFGIAASASEGGADLTEPGRMIGSSRYMSPEQALGEPASPASDLFSLGVVAYEMLFGAPPFPADRQAHRLADAIAGSFQRPSAHLGHSAPQLDAFFVRAFDRDPGARFASVESFLEALARSLRDLGERPRLVPRDDATSTTTREEVVVAGPRKGQRRRLAAVALAALLLAGLALARWLREPTPSDELAEPTRGAPVAVPDVATAPPPTPNEAAVAPSAAASMTAPTSPRGRPPRRSSPTASAPPAPSAAPEASVDPFSGIAVDP